MEPADEDLQMGDAAAAVFKPFQAEYLSFTQLNEELLQIQTICDSFAAKSASFMESNNTSLIWGELTSFIQSVHARIAQKGKEQRQHEPDILVAVRRLRHLLVLLKQESIKYNFLLRHEDTTRSDRAPVLKPTDNTFYTFKQTEAQVHYFGLGKANHWIYFFLSTCLAKLEANERFFASSGCTDDRTVSTQVEGAVKRVHQSMDLGSRSAAPSTDARQTIAKRRLQVQQQRQLYLLYEAECYAKASLLFFLIECEQRKWDSTFLATTDHRLSSKLAVGDISYGSPFLHLYICAVDHTCRCLLQANADEEQRRGSVRRRAKLITTIWHVLFKAASMVEGQLVEDISLFGPHNFPFYYHLSFHYYELSALLCTENAPTIALRQFFEDSPAIPRQPGDITCHREGLRALMNSVALEKGEPLTLIRPCCGGLFLLSLQRCVRLTVRRTYSGVAHHTSGGLVSHGSFTSLLFYSDFALGLFEAEENRAEKSQPSDLSSYRERRFKLCYLSYYVFFLLIKLIAMVKLDEEITPADSSAAATAPGGGIHSVLARFDALAEEIASVAQEASAAFTASQKASPTTDGRGGPKATKKGFLSSARYTAIKERAKSDTKKDSAEATSDRREENGPLDGMKGSLRLHSTVRVLCIFLRSVLRKTALTGRGASASRVSFPAHALIGTPKCESRNQWALEELNGLMVKLGVRDRGCVLLLFKRVISV